MFGAKRSALPEETGPIVRFDRVSLRYDEGAPALDRVSFTLQPGGFAFLTGPSGAGKTSLLKLMYLALRPTGGAITLLGTDVTAARRSDLPLLRREIGVVFQDFRLLDHLSVYENVALPLRVQGQRPAQYRDDVLELLRWVGLGDRLAASPATLSGGEKQRVAIARAIVAKPRLLIADEPTGNVDPEMASRLMRLFVELNRVGATVVIATHDADIVRRVGAPVLRLEAGRLSSQTGAAP